MTRKPPDRSPPSLLLRLEERLFRILVWLYPGSFRRRFGDEMVTFFHAERGRDRHRGPTGALRFWKATLADLTAAVVRGHTLDLPREPVMQLTDLSRHFARSVRSLRRQPAFSIAVVLTLTVGIAAVLVVFALVDAALLEALPFADGDRLVFVQGTTVEDRADVRGASVPEMREWIEQAPGFAGMAGVVTPSLNLVLEDGVLPVPSELVSGEFFDVLRVAPLKGRLLGPEDDRVPDGHPVVVIGEALWEEQFGRDPDVVGRVARFNERELTVVGVVPGDFGGVTLQAQAWVPLAMASMIGRDVVDPDWGNRWLYGIARLAEGVSLESAQAGLDAVALELAERRPDTNEGRTGTLRAARSLYLGTAEDLLLVLLVGAGGLLAVATLNAAGLLVVKGGSRTDEYAICRALGASRAAVAGRALMDALVLAAVAAGLAWLIGRWTLDLIVAWLPAGALPDWVEPAIDGSTLLVTCAIVAVSALAAGLIPALQSARGDLTGPLRDVRSSARGAAGSWWRSPQQLLVVGEVAVALVLLVGMGLMARTFEERLGVDVGFEPAGLSSARIRLTGEIAQDPAARTAFAERARARVAALPDVGAVSFGSDVPLRGGFSASRLLLEPENPDSLVRYYVHRVAPDFREHLGVELLAGRDITADDAAGAPRVMLVGRDLAERYLGGVEAAIGRELQVGREDVATVVGVVETVRWRDLTADLGAGEDDPDAYFPFAQQPAPVFELALRVRPGSDADLLPRLREAVADVDPSAAVFALADLEEQVVRQTAGDRLTVTILAVFGAAALLLAGVAVYSSLTNAVAHRRREIAIRQALGASAPELRQAVLRQGAGLTAIGALVGCAVAFALNRLLADLLYGVSTLDPVTYVAVLAALLAVALLATWVPALRATRVPPQSALRS